MPETPIYTHTHTLTTTLIISTTHICTSTINNSKSHFNPSQYHQILEIGEYINKIWINLNLSSKIPIFITIQKLMFVNLPSMLKLMEMMFKLIKETLTMVILKIKLKISPITKIKWKLKNDTAFTLLFKFNLNASSLFYFDYYFYQFNSKYTFQSCHIIKLVAFIKNFKIYFTICQKL